MKYQITRIGKYNTIVVINWY